MSRVFLFCKLLLQLALFCGLFWLCNRWAAQQGWLIPGGVIGLGILITLLLTGVVPEKAVRTGATWLLSELLLFFIPPVVSIIKYWALIRADALPLLATVILGTVMVLAGTAWVVDRVYTLEKRLNERRATEAGRHV